jgi:flagellar export protein FliJ
MSSGLHTLIRLHKWRLDEKRRALAELQALADKLAQDTARLEREIVAEQEIARTSPEAAFGYGNFAKQSIERRRRLAQSVAQVEHQIAEATEEMAEAFQELKRYELAQEGRDRRDEAKRKVRENAALDEVALSGFTRRREP